MNITGPTVRLRPLELRDAFLVAETFRDWPRHRKLGRYILARAIADTDRNLIENEAFEYPLTARSSWTQTLVIYTDDMPLGVGIHRARASGRVVNVLEQAILPSARGRGLFSELNQVLARYAFETLGANVVPHELLDGSAAAKTYVANRPELYAELGEADGHTGKVRRGRHRAADWAAWAAANPLAVPEYQFSA